MLYFYAESLALKAKYWLCFLRQWPDDDGDDDGAGNEDDESTLPLFIHPSGAPSGCESDVSQRASEVTISGA